MTHPRPFVRAIAAVLAAAQFAVSAGAPALDAFAAAEQQQTWYPDGSSVHAAPAYTHDAATCPVCRLLDSPARLDINRETAEPPACGEAPPPLEPRFVQRLTHPGFLSRAPPSLIC